VLDGEPVRDRRRLTCVQCELPGQLAEVGLLDRLGGRLAQPDLVRVPPIIPLLVARRRSLRSILI
jgi:hypothetical protein